MDQFYSTQMTKAPQSGRIMFENRFDPYINGRGEKTMGRRKIVIDRMKAAWRENPYVRLIAIVLLIVLVTNSATAFVTSRRVSSRLEEEYAEKLAVERWSAEQKLASQLREEYGVTDAEALEIRIQEEAKTIAKILYPMRNNKANGLRSAVWCVLNRVDNPLDMYPDDVYSVCSQKLAFMGWSDENPVIENLYSIALKELRVWHNGIRPMGTEFVILYWDSREIILRDQIQEHGAHVWTEDDWDVYDESHS